MTAVVQSPDCVDAEAVEDDTVVRNLPPELRERDREWMGHRDPAPNFDPHWAQIQLALAVLLWGIVILVVRL
jgi:hypothetical protein